jgi:uncharacterized membrane protein YczE
VRAPPRIRGGLTARLASLGFGLFLFACGVVAFLESKLGLPPWDVLHQGIAKHSPLSFGEAVVGVGLCVLVVAALLGARIGVGTVANAVLVGLVIVGLTAIGPIERLSGDPLAVRIGLLAAGLALIGVGTAFYLAANLGAGPRDSLMVVGATRLPLRIALVRAAIELAALGAGIALGGRVGIGTLVFAVGIGPTVEGAFWLFQKSALAT